MEKKKIYSDSHKMLPSLPAQNDMTDVATVTGEEESHCFESICGAERDRELDIVICVLRKAVPGTRGESDLGQ